MLIDTYNMDAILHNTFYDKSEELKEFMATRVGKVIADLCTPMDDSMKMKSFTTA
ncbi:MAG: hypothetical protein IJ628_03505 [Bacteroidaceae bacterium]|nr:hypothetical protein [Bacteroidaceae bacterium]